MVYIKGVELYKGLIFKNHPSPSLLSQANTHTVEPLLRGHPDQRPPPLERPLDNVYLNIND